MPVQARNGIVLLDEVGGQRHALAVSLYSQERGSVQEAVWAPGPVYTVVENLDPTEFRSPDRPVHSIVAIPTALRGKKVVNT